MPLGPDGPGNPVGPGDPGGPGGPTLSLPVFWPRCPRVESKKKGLQGWGRWAVSRNHVAGTAYSLGASFFAQKRGRNASDWWRSASDHGKVKKERRRDVLAVFSFPPSFARKFSSRERDLWVRGNRRHVFRTFCTIAKISGTICRGDKVCFPRVTFKVTNNRDQQLWLKKVRMNRSQKNPIFQSVSSFSTI